MLLILLRTSCHESFLMYELFNHYVCPKEILRLFYEKLKKRNQNHDLLTSKKKDKRPSV